MKILQVANGFPPADRGGVEVYTLGLSKALRAMGHQVAIFCRELGGNRPLYSIRDEVIDGLPVRLVVNRFDAAAPLGPRYYDKYIETLFIEWVQQQQPDLIHFQHTHGLSASLLGRASQMGIPYTLTLWDYWYMCPRITLLRPDDNLCPGSHHQVNCYECIYHHKFPLPGRHIPDFDQLLPEMSPTPIQPHPLRLSHTLYTILQQILPWPVRRKLLEGYDLIRLKIRPRLSAVLMMGQEPDLTPLRVRAQYMQETLSLCQHIIAPLRFVKAQYVDFGIPETQIHVISPGMDLRPWQDFQPAPRPHRDHLRFGYIGSLTRHKGVDLIIRAFQRLPAPHLELWLHGFELPNSAFAQSLHQMAAHDPRIHFAGPYNSADLPAILNRLDVLLIPSIWHETFSFVTREAILAGLPVIASQMGGIPEAIEEGINGFLLPPGDLTAWTAAMSRLVEDHDLITAFHQAQLARQVKSMAEHAAELIQFYEQLPKPTMV